MNIGVTGHQNIGGVDVVSWVETNLRSAIFNSQISRAYSCMAIGTDQLFARIILAMQFDLVAIIPCMEYETTFKTKKELREYSMLKMEADEVIQMPAQHPSEEAFYNASKLLVDRSDLLLAVWNNQPSKGLGGTADVVAYALNKGITIIHINPSTKTVKTI